MAINPSEPQIPQPGSPVIHWLLEKANRRC